MPGIDLAAYLHRIGYDGPAAARIEVLQALQVLHPQAIAFENLDPFLHRPVNLDLAALQQKLVHDGRGGYCFEQNLLFMHALRAIGFTVSGLAARVLWGRPDDAVTAKGHMLLRVEIEGRIWLADVGFGGLTQTAPLLFQPGLEQATPHETFRILPGNNLFRVQADTGGTWRTLYAFDLQEQFEVDYAVSNYFLSTHPDSHFRNRIVAARAFPGGRYALADNLLSTHRLGQASERRPLQSARDIAVALDELFGVTVPDAASFEAAVRRENLLEPKT